MDHRTFLRGSRLYLAIVKGDLETFSFLIREDPLILEEATVGYLDQNPLHIAASVGHLAFTRELLILNPNLATKPDSRGRFPIHLASEKGHVEIVRELLLHPNDDVCLQVDKKGRIPLHLAAMQGHVNVIMELIGARPESIYNMVTNREMELTGETVLHLCARYNRLEALQLLLGLAPSDLLVRANDDDGSTVLHLCVRYNLLEALKLLLDLAPSSLVSALDNDGNTVLHLAAALKNMEIIKYLLSLPDVKGLLATMKNMKKFTALDVLELEQSTITDAKSIEIQDVLLQAGVPRARELPKKIARFLRKYFTMDDSWIKESRGHLITTSTVIATVAFQAAVNPPGGVWQDDVKSSNGTTQGSHEAVKCSNGTTQGSHEAGTSIMASLANPSSSILYTVFVTYNALSFALSLVVILLLISGLAFKSIVLMVILNIAVFYSIISMVTAFLASAQVTIPDIGGRGDHLAVISYSTTLICFVVLLAVMCPYAFYISKWVKSKLQCIIPLWGNFWWNFMLQLSMLFLILYLIQLTVPLPVREELEC